MRQVQHSADPAALRVAQVHSSDIGGGAEAVARLHHLEMRRRRIDASLFVAQKTGGDPGVERIDYVRGPMGFRRLARFIERTTGRQYVYSPSFRALLDGLPERADLVHLHSLHGQSGYADISGVSRLSQRVPTVVTLHDLWLLTGHCAHPLECGRWMNGCGACPDLARYPSIPRDGTRANWKRKQSAFEDARVHLVVPSAWVEHQVRNSEILGHLPVSVVHNPVDTGVFFPRDRGEARHRLNLPATLIVLLVAQYLNSRFKGVSQGIEALNLLPNPKPFLVAIGKDAATALARYDGNGVSVEYQDEQSGLADYYRAADVLLMPSIAETFGMVAAESMACATPVVAFAAGGLVDVVGEAGGVLVPEGDVAAMSAALATLLAQHQHRIDLGSSAAKSAATRFGLASHTDSCLRIYESLLDSQRQTGTTAA